MVPLAGVVLAGAVCASAAVVNVSVVNYAFVPASVTINTNDSVAWHWAVTGGYGGGGYGGGGGSGGTQHSTTSDTMGLWDSGLRTGPSVFVHTFTSTGNYPYHCTLHASIGMTGQVTVNAQFTPPPPFIAGTYSGLFFGSNTVSQASSGSFMMTTTARGRFTGSLLNGLTRMPFSGQFDPAGNAVRAIPRLGKAPLTVSLHLDTNHLDIVAGTVSDGNFVAGLLGNRADFDGRLQKAPEAGLYTLAIVGAPNSNAAPGGDGYAAVNVSSAGILSMAGSLADGTKVAGAAVLSGNGDWPLYVPLYGGQGSILSWVLFQNTAADDASGGVAWIRPPIPRARFYPAGFAQATTATGFQYHPPASGHSVLTVTNALVTLSGGGLAANIEENIAIGPGNRVKDLGTNRLAMVLVPSSGLFWGTVKDPATRKSVLFSGVVLQNLNQGTGYFLGTSQSGKVTLAPR